MKIEFFRLQGQNFLENFREILRTAKKRNLHFAVLSCHVLSSSEEAEIKALTKKDEVRNAAVSVAVGRITGKGLNFSPKLPYVSDDGIIVNVTRCLELDISQHLQDVNTHSHFEDAGGIHATVLSFLESIVPYGMLYTYSYWGDKQLMSSSGKTITARALRVVKGMFNRVNYEIQKKYDDKT